MEEKLNEIIQKLSITEFKVENLIQELNKKSDIIDKLKIESDIKIADEIADIKDDLEKITKDFETALLHTDKSLVREITYLKEKISELKKDVDELKGKDSLIENTLSANEKDKFNKLYQVVIGIVMLIIGAIVSMVFQYINGK